MDTGLLLIGSSHQHAPLAIRERLAVGPEHTAELAHALAATCEGAVVLSTCARTEIYLSSSATPAPEEKAIETLRRVSRLPDNVLRPVLYRRCDEEAVQHLLRVAAGLDSIVLGEGEILRQLRQALALGAPGPVLNRLFCHALHAGKRARSETQLTRQSGSLASTAADAVQRTLGGLTDKTVLVIGAGRISALCATALAARGTRIAFVANRTPSRAAPLAQTFDAQAVGLDLIPETLPRVDAVISATSAPDIQLTTAQVRQALQARPGRVLCLVDLAVPRDIDGTAGALDGCTLHTLEQLEAARRLSQAATNRAVAEAERIVDDELRRFGAWHTARAVAPTIAALHAQAEEIRAAELTRAERKLRSLTPTQRQHVETITAQILSKLLHLPTTRLKEAANTPEHALYLDAVNHLFGITENALV